MSEFEFHLRATPHDREGYYYPRWDRATPITVRAATKQQAINQAASALGACPRGRGWFWGFKVDSIAPAPHVRPGRTRGHRGG